MNETNEKTAVPPVDVPRLVLPFELRGVDADIREHFASDLSALYVPKLPILIQIERNLRRLLDESNDRENCSDYGECAQDDIEPQEAIGQSRLGSFVSVDSVGKGLACYDGDCALDLLVKLGAGLRVVTESLDQLSDLHVDIPASLRFVHNISRQNGDVEPPR